MCIGLIINYIDPVKYDVLYEDNHLLVVNKPVGWLSQGDKTNDLTISDPYKKYIKEKYDKPGNVFLHPAHRLDRPVSGCLILGRTSKGLKRVNQLFAENLVVKEYMAIVHGRPEQDSQRLEHWLLKDKNKNKTKCYHKEVAHSKKAILSYKLAGSMNRSALLIIQPKTGRSHQIRSQLSHISLPIVGDLKYGSDKALSNKGIALHCYRMSFKHPTKDEQVVVSTLPDLKVWPWDIYKRISSSI